VGGDLRNLVTSNNVGGNESVAGVATYRTGFDLRVGGKLGNTTVNGAFNGTVEVVNNPEINGIETPFEELEYVPLTGETPGAVFLTGLLATDVVRNDRPQDVQYGSSIGSVISGDISGVDFSGSINTVRGDSVDSFGVPLISGQTITVLLDSELGVLNVGIFDPLGRLVATDIGNATGRGDGEQFRYTAETPGVYRLAVATTGNSTFSSDGDGAAVDNYTLSVQGFSPVAIGGMRVGGDATFGEIGFFGLPGAPRTAATGVLVRTGDIGALDIDGGLYAQFGSVIQARRGNLRALYGREIGEVDPEQVLVPELDIPRGTVGHIRSLGTLHINQTASDGVDFIPSRAIGFDYQRVEAAGDFVGNLVANGSIGGVFAGSVGTSEVTSAPLFVANADRNDENGRIDLIDVTGDFGSDEIGGPGLFTGRGGNVKYVRVGGTVVSDQYFGGSLSSEIQGAPGETLRVTDDSGATAVLIPTSQTQTTPGGGSTPGGTVTAPGSIRLTSYGVREAGGVVLINVTASTNVTVQASGGAGTVDISQLNINGSGSTLAYNGDTRRVGYVIPTTGGNTGGGGGAGGDGTSAAPVRVVPRNPGATTVASTSDPRAPTNGTFTPAPSTTPTQTIGAPAIAGNVLSSAPQIRNDLTFAGRLPINVFEIAAVNLTNVINGTAGEIVGMEAYTVAAIQAQSLGYMKTSIPGKIAVASNNPVTLATQPFDPYTYGLYINGPVVDVLSREAIGNLYVYGATATSEGVVRNIRANADQRGTRGMFEGITGVVAAENIQSIDVGEGLAFSGTGDVINGGIYGIEGGPNDATAEIGTVVANNADIRGQIGSEGVIRSIIVNNGSINSARIGITTTIGQLRYANSEPITLPDAETEVIPGSRPANPGTGTPG
ncbi:MAG TPA: hypothetical protein VGB55_05885, partial [Tepidisphaeraceae bacterium]